MTSVNGIAWPCSPWNVPNRITHHLARHLVHRETQCCGSNLEGSPLIHGWPKRHQRNVIRSAELALSSGRHAELILLTDVIPLNFG
jgi:hypothetical protein